MHFHDRLLIDAGANLENADGGDNTPLIWACVNGSEPTVQLLLAAGANKEAATSSVGAKGWTPLIWASSMGHAGVAKILIAAGADKHATTADGKTAKEQGARHAAITALF